MNWKGRQMFGGGPSGIVQMMGGGMTPYPSHTMPDGTVMRGAVHGQGYEEGGPVEAVGPLEDLPLTKYILSLSKPKQNELLRTL